MRTDLGTDTEPLPIHFGSDRRWSICLDRHRSAIIIGDGVSPMLLHLNGDACAQRMSVLQCTLTCASWANCEWGVWGRPAGDRLAADRMSSFAWQHTHTHTPR